MPEDRPLDQPNQESSASAETAVQLPFREILSRLARLQEKDNVIIKIKAVIDGIPAKIDEQSAAIEQLKHELEASKAHSKQLLLDKKSAENDLATVEQQIKKHAGELGQVKSNEAYKALLTEIDQLKKKQDDLESKILEIFDQIEASKKTEQQANALFEQKKKAVEQEIQALQSVRQEKETALAQEMAAREGLLKEVPEEALEHYEKLRARRGGVALAPLSNTSCGGCQMSLTAGVINNLLKMKDFIVCERCQRILYIPPEKT